MITGSVGADTQSLLFKEATFDCSNASSEREMSACATKYLEQAEERLVMRLSQLSDSLELEQIRRLKGVQVVWV